MSEEGKNLFTDQDYLTKEQYRNASNLNARISLHRDFSTNKQSLYDWVFKTIGTLPDDSKLLELGCGPCGLWVEIGNRIPSQWEIELSDLSPGMLETGRKNLADIPMDFQFKVIDAQQIPFDDQTFDGVIANHMLYHVPDIGKALAEIHRVLKPDGRLFANTNGKNHMIELRRLIQTIDPQAKMSASSDYFGLENGFDLLAQVFPEVSMMRHENGLEVTAMQPLLDYILSMDQSDKIKQNPQLVADKIAQEIKTKGAFHIQKDMGMFVATRN